MRLREFDKDDEFAHSLRDGHNRTVKERMDDIEHSFKSNEGIYQHYIQFKSGNKNKINDIMILLLQEVENFYDFCNNCNDDNETRQYLDRLIEISKSLNQMLDNI
jgi:hypothetical protein